MQFSHRRCYLTFRARSPCSSSCAHVSLPLQSFVCFTCAPVLSSWKLINFVKSCWASHEVMIISSVAVKTIPWVNVINIPQQLFWKNMILFTDRTIDILHLLSCRICDSPQLSNTLEPSRKFLDQSDQSILWQTRKWESRLLCRSADAGLMMRCSGTLMLLFCTLGCLESLCAISDDCT
jgi:hypothetical protein